AVRLLVASLKPFQIQGEVHVLSKDFIGVAATVAVEFQVDPEKPANILGLMNERQSLAKNDIFERVIPHLSDRVFAAIIKEVNADSVRGNTALQDKIQAEILKETERIFKDLGIIVRAASLTWALNKQEVAMVQRS